MQPCISKELKPCAQGRAWHLHVQEGDSRPVLSSKEKGSPSCLRPQQALPYIPFKTETLWTERTLERKKSRIPLGTWVPPIILTPWDGGSNSHGGGASGKKRAKKINRGDVSIQDSWTYFRSCWGLWRGDSSGIASQKSLQSRLHVPSGGQTAS